MKPGFLLGTSARSLRFGTAFLCLAGLLVAGPLHAADDNDATAVGQQLASPPDATQTLPRHHHGGTRQTTAEAAAAAGAEPLTASGAMGNRPADATPPSKRLPAEEPAGQLPWLIPYEEGNPKAPLVVTMYFTPFCRTCAESYARNHPIFKKYIDMNLILLRYQDIAFDEPTMRMITVLHCLPKDQYLDNLNGLYDLRLARQAVPETVKTWVQTLWSKNNMTADFALKCMADPKLNQSRNATRHFARTYLGVRHPPTYLFGASQYRVGNMAPPDVIEAILKRLLAHKTPAAPTASPASAQPTQPAQ